MAVLIVQQELGISNELTEQLCNTGKNTDCDAVMHSKGSRVAKWFNWADAGIIYFSSFLLILVSSSPGLLILAVISAAAIPFTFFSLYYQWGVVKKWCPLCLITVAVLWVQFILLLPLLIKFDMAAVEKSEAAFTVFIITVVAAVWLLIIKPIFDKNKELTGKNYSLLRFKNNPDIFITLLQQQRRVDITPFENDLQLGNSAAPVQIMVACNPYCGPCAKAHEALDKLIEKNDIGLTVRFAVKAESKEDKRTQAVEYLLQVLNDMTNIYKRKVLNNWYAGMNMKKFKDIYPLKERTAIDDLLNNYAQWSEIAKITFTPTIFINGYELPKQYGIGDLEGLLKIQGTGDSESKTPVSKPEKNYVMT
jgi:uncharacterized membrane protein/thiol-disulfide isomerase/thioredoxin